jgi:hypothetical protein
VQGWSLAFNPAQAGAYAERGVESLLNRGYQRVARFFLPLPDDFSSFLFFYSLSFLRYLSLFQLFSLSNQS